MSNIWKCPNCKDDVKKEDTTIIVRCKCGEFMEIIKELKGGKD